MLRDVRVRRLGAHERRVTVWVLVIRRGQPSKLGDGVRVVGGDGDDHPRRMVDGFVFREHEGSVEARGVAVEPGCAEPGGFVARTGVGVADGVARGAAVAREGDEARDVPGDLGEGAREGRLVRGCPRRDRPGHVVVGDVRGGLATLRQAVDPDRELREGVGGSLGVVPHGHVQTAELAEGAEQIGERQSARRARRVHRGGGDHRHHGRVPRLDAAAVLQQTLPVGRHRRHRRPTAPQKMTMEECNGRDELSRGATISRDGFLEAAVFLKSHSS